MYRGRIQPSIQGAKALYNVAQPTFLCHFQGLSPPQTPYNMATVAGGFPPDLPCCFLPPFYFLCLENPFLPAWQTLSYFIADAQLKYS
jgi:hypothetical protein